MPIYQACISGWWHCRECDTARLICPSCGTGHALRRQEQSDPFFPSGLLIPCPCRAALIVTIAGYTPNPATEEAGVGAHDPMVQTLEQALQRNAARRRQPPRPTRAALAPRRARRSNPRPRSK